MGFVSPNGNLDLRIWTRTLDVVGNGDTCFEFIAWSGQDRHTRRDYKGASDQCFSLGRANTVRCHGHSRDLHRAIEIIRNVIHHLALFRTGIDYSGPENYRLFSDTLKWIEVLNVAAAAISRRRSEKRKLRQDQVHDLRGVDP